MADPERERGHWEGPNFKKGPQFLKSNRISHAYGLTSNKYQTFSNKSCFVFLLCRKYVDFIPVLHALGGRVLPPWINRDWWVRINWYVRLKTRRLNPRLTGVFP